jgi:hypothetical protein
MSMIHSPGMEHLTKETKGTKSKSFARRAISYLPAAGTAAKYGLKAANVADFMGLIKNPQLKAGLRAANTFQGFANTRLGNFALSQIANAAKKA